MKRQILCLLLALALALALCACGNTRYGYTNDMPDPDDGYIENGNADDGVVDDNVRGGVTGSGNTTGDAATRSGNPTDGSGNAAGSGRTDGMGNRPSVPGVSDHR